MIASAAWVCLGLLIGTVALVSADVALAIRDSELSGRFPEMYPPIRFYFIPIAFAFAAAIAVPISLLARLLIRGDRPLRPWESIALGIAYSLVLLPLPMRYLAGHVPFLLCWGLILSPAAAIALRARFFSRGGEA